MEIKTKICRFCHEGFNPDYRVIERQYACSKPDCQRIRQKLNQIDWLERFPNYYSQWYQDYGKAWYQRHPDYHNKYRQKKNTMKQNNKKLVASVIAPFHIVTWVVQGKRKLKSWSLNLTNGTTIYFINAQDVMVFPLQL